MSAIVSTYVIDDEHVPGLLEAVRRASQIFDKPIDRFPECFKVHARLLATYDASGFIFNPLLLLLEEHGIDVMNSKHDALAQQMRSERGGLLYFFLTSEHRGKVLEDLRAFDMSKSELEEYYQVFNEESAPGVGQEMLQGIQFLVSAIEAVPENGVVLFEMA